MANLIEKSALTGLLPVTRGGLTLSARDDLAPITSIAPFAASGAQVATRLRKIGLDWPAPNQSVTGQGAACLSAGRGQAFLLGRAAPDLGGLAAMTDQSDGWAVMTLSGPRCREALARLVAVDMRDATFPVGQVVRTGLGHMMAMLWRRAAETVDIFVFRSMAVTAVHEIDTAMKALAARAGH